MDSKDSKRTIRTYNRLMLALMEFQGLWHHAWLQSVENSKAQLQATLLAEAPDTGGWAMCRVRRYRSIKWRAGAAHQGAHTTHWPCCPLLSCPHVRQCVRAAEGACLQTHSSPAALASFSHSALAPMPGKLVVNFDRGILQLLRETRHMKLLGLRVPDSALAVQMQDGKLKGYYNDLTHALKVGAGRRSGVGGAGLEGRRMECWWVVGATGVLEKHRKPADVWLCRLHPVAGLPGLIIARPLTAPRITAPTAPAAPRRSWTASPPASSPPCSCCCGRTWPTWTRRSGPACRC